MKYGMNVQVLQQRHAKVEAERDQLYSKFEASIYSVQQKTGVRNLLLEKKLSALGGVLEHKEAQLAEVMAASNLDPATLAQLNTVSPLLLVGFVLFVMSMHDSVLSRGAQRCGSHWKEKVVKHLIATCQFGSAEHRQQSLAWLALSKSHHEDQIARQAQNARVRVVL